MKHTEIQQSVEAEAQSSTAQPNAAQQTDAQLRAAQPSKVQPSKVQPSAIAQNVAFHPLLKGAFVGSYLLAFLYIQSFLFSSYGNSGYWEFAFVLCFLGAGEVLVRALAHSKCRILPLAVLPPDEIHVENSAITSPAFVAAPPAASPKEATFWAVCATGIGLACALNTFFGAHRALFWDWIEGYDRGLILIYGRFCLHVIAAYWAVCRFGWLCRGTTSAWLVVDACNAMVVFPFAKFFLRVQLFWQGVHRLWQQHLVAKIEKKPSAITLAIVGVFGVFFVVAVNLLRASDAIFADFLAQFAIRWQWEASLPLAEYGLRFLLSLPVGAYFFGLFVRCMQLRGAPSALETECTASLAAVQKLRVVTPRTLTVVLACFVGLYLLYFGVQAEYYLSAFWGDLPARVTFAEYARQGFFELCKLMALNFILLCSVAKVSATPLRTCKGLCIAANALLASSLLFAATALAKLVLYIQAYGFTELRLLSAWAITVLVVAVVLALQTLRKAQPVAAKLIYFAAGSFTLLCLLAS